MFQPRRPCTAPACLGLLVAVGLLLPGCNRVPELDSARGDALRHAPYPALIPLEHALAINAAEPDSAERLEREMGWRRARLEARAARLRAAQSE